MKMGAKSRRNETSYDLEKLRIGTGEGNDTRTIQYPVFHGEQKGYIVQGELQ